MAETTPTLGTNPQITKMVLVLVLVERDELEFEPLSMVAMMVGGRAKEALPWKFKEQRRGFIVFYWSRFVVSVLICLLLLCDLCLLLSSLLISTTQVFGFLSPLLISILYNSRLIFLDFLVFFCGRLEFHMDFYRNQVIDTRVATMNSSLKDLRC